MKKLIQNIVIVSSLTTATAPAFSEIYGGVSLGQADPENSDAQTSWELKAGYRLNDYVAFEGFYLDLGKSESTNILGTFSNETNGIGASVLGLYPITETIDVYGKLGMYSWDATTSFRAGNINGGDVSESDTDLIYGIGAAWKVNDLLRLNVAYDAINFDEFDQKTDVYSVGASIIF